jgi:hypothetical protein
MKEFLRPWKLATLAIGIALLIFGAFYTGLPDWDIPVSLIMGALAYCFAAWSMRVILERRWRQFPLMLLATWLTVDGSYWAYWSAVNPGALVLRPANFAVSLSLYGMCGLVWYYRGTLREMRDEYRAFLRPSKTR